MKKLLFLIAIPFVLAGCVQVQTNENPRGGVYRSTDNGQTFEQISKIARVGEDGSFEGDNVTHFMFDPTDASTLYYASREGRLQVTYDGGANWRTILSNRGTVRKVLIDPDAPCHVYAVMKKNLLESNDCGRSWETPYVQRIPGINILDVAFDPANSTRMFMTHSDGSILVSEDAGRSWAVWSRFIDGIQTLQFNPDNNQIVYAMTGENFYRSTNQGLEWEALGSVITKDFGFKQGQVVKDMVFIPEYDDGFYTISGYGILKSPDGGATWEDVPLIPKPKKDNILSLAVNPDNMDEFYYSTPQAIYYSRDGGVNWITVQSPTNRQNRKILVHPRNFNVLYLAPFAPQQ